VDSLQTQKRDLNTDNQSILSSLINSRHTFEFLQGRVNSLRNGILDLILIGVNLTYLMKLQTNVDRSDEFGSLTRAYKGEEPVSIQEIKKEVIKAMEAAQLLKLCKVNLMH
jgi:hypothetical protein